MEVDKAELVEGGERRDGPSEIKGWKREREDSAVGASDAHPISGACVPAASNGPVSEEVAMGVGF